MIQKFIRKLTKTGSHSYTINVPKEIVTDLGWRERQKLEVSYDEKKKQTLLKKKNMKSDENKKQT